MIIRKAEKKDIESIIQLLDDLERAHIVLDLSETERAFVQRAQDVKGIIKFGLEKALNKDHLLLVAESDGNIVGYLKAEIEKRSLTKLHDKKLYIRHIIILKQYRNKGIGTQFIKEAEKFAAAKNIPFITLKTSTKNKEALDFYKNLGFQDIYIELVKKQYGGLK